LWVVSARGGGPGGDRLGDLAAERPRAGFGNGAGEGQRLRGRQLAPPRTLLMRK
jgi:hypothetical protein